MRTLKLGAMNQTLHKTCDTNNANQTPENKFPFSVFPPVIQTYIEECERYLGYPPEYTAASIFAAASIAIGNTRKIRLRKGFEDMANIYLLLVGPPSANKTRTIKSSINFFQQLDAEHHAKTLAECHMQRSTTKAVGVKNLPARHRNYILDDATPESVSSELERNQRGCLLVCDEVDQLLNSGRYNAGGSIEPLYNTYWSRETKKITRATRDQIFVKDPFLSLIAGTQYSRASQLFKGRESSGFTHRFCYVILKEVPVHKWNIEDKVPALDFESIIKKLHKNLHLNISESGDNMPETVTIMPEGVCEIINWQHHLKEQSKKEDDYFQSVLGKMESYCLRYTLILHYLKWATSEGLDEFTADLETAKNAIMLSDFFLEESMRFQKLVYSNDSITDSLPINKRDFYNELDDNFQRIDAVKIGEKYDLSPRTVDNFIGSSKLFKKVKQGTYQKLQR